MAYLTRRILKPELMDDPNTREADLRRSLAFLRRVNRYLGGRAAVLQHLARWSVTWPRHRTIRMLDVATGSADLPLAIVMWARKRRHRVHVTATDRQATTLRLAAQYLSDHGNPSNIKLIRADALDPPFAHNSFDYCITSLFLHHLSDLQVMTMLKIMDDLSTCGLIWNDLLRNRRAFRWCKLLTRRSHPIVRHDGPVSVLAGFTKHEVLAFRDRLELRHLTYHRNRFHRFTLAGQR